LELALHASDVLSGEGQPFGTHHQRCQHDPLLARRRIEFHRRPLKDCSELAICAVVADLQGPDGALPARIRDISPGHRWRISGRAEDAA
jgi:hypothetical protein